MPFAGVVWHVWVFVQLHGASGGGGRGAWRRDADVRALDGVCGVWGVGSGESGWDGAARAVQAAASEAGGGPIGVVALAFVSLFCMLADGGGNRDQVFLLSRGNRLRPAHASGPRSGSDSEKRELGLGSELGETATETEFGHPS